MPRLATAQLFMFTAANGYMNHYFAAHYFKDLHIDYNEDANKKAKEEGLEEWWQLFNRTREKTRPYIHYPGPPYLFAWVPTSVTMDRTVWDRNPYYWKVDEAGNRAVPRQALPAGSVARHQPRRDQRHRIPGAGHAAARLRPRRRAVLR